MEPKYAWPDLMQEVEDVGHHLAELSSAVAAKNRQLKAPALERATVKWCAQLEIDLIYNLEW